MIRALSDIMSVDRQSEVPGIWQEANYDPLS